MKECEGMTRAMTMDFWGKVEWEPDWIRGYPNENCGPDKPLYILDYGVPGLPIAVKPGQLLTVYACCESDDRKFLPKEDEFYFELSFCHKEGISDNIRAMEVFEEQEEWTAFTMRLPQDADPEEHIWLGCELQCYHPDSHITIDTHYIVSD